MLKLVFKYNADFLKNEVSSKFKAKQLWRCFNQKYNLKQQITFEMAYSCFRKGGILKIYFPLKKLYNIKNDVKTHEYEKIARTKKMR